ncbi:conserved hypothetical protein [Agrobacterium tumefaciens str. Kerr 14]|uniref:Uncharacterized protein n=1 Tax=Agrobacterium tumefaciens str. Kerr 14 TaxID=1183424 RepID=A0A1S7SC52_AGRTU|nr:conserved hypothetical protein [Agrobacterium tumefaciens str. Kerr 14]
MPSVPWRGEASLAASRSQAAPRRGNAGSMSRPGMVFIDGLQIVFVIEFVARQNAELVAGPEKRDWNHQGAGKLEGVVLRKGKIGVHLRLHLWSGPFPLDGSRQCPEPVAIIAKAQPKRPQLATGPRQRVDRRRSGSRPGSHPSRAGLGRLDRSASDRQ